MRNLIIQRKSASTGRFAKMNVYIEDAKSGEITLNDLPCRKIGVLKNDDIKTFSITEEATKIIVVANQEEKTGYLEVYSLEEGSEDIVLSGETIFGRNGKFVFKFDSKNNQINPKSIKTRVILKRTLVRVLIMALCVLGLRSCVPTPQAFSYGGVNITLTTAFERKANDDYVAKYLYSKAGVFIDKKIQASEYKGISTKEYAEKLIANMETDATVTKNQNGLVMFQYETNPGQKDALTHFVYCYNDFPYFWTVDFIVFSKNADSYREKIDEWANSVSFS